MKLRKSVINTLTCIGLVVTSGQLLAQESTVKAIPAANIQTSQVSDGDAWHKVADGALDTLGNIAPTPFNFGISLFKSLIPWPGDDETQTLTYQKLLQIEAKVDADIKLTSLTRAEISKFAKQYNDNYLNDKVLNQNEMISHIMTTYNQFYDYKALPHKSDEFYSYAQSVCKGGVCGDNEAMLIKLLGGKPILKSTKPLLLSSNMTDLYSLTMDFQHSISDGSIKGWEALQKAYLAAQETDDRTQDQKMVKFLAANQSIFQLQVDYYNSYTKLFNMLDMQLAFYYAHPELFKNSDVQILPGVLPNEKQGEEGYLLARENLQNIFLSPSSNGRFTAQLIKIFGKKGQSGIIDALSSTQFVNQYIEQFSGQSDLLSASQLCEPVSLYMPNEYSGLHVGRLTSRCQTDNFDNDKNKPTSYNLKGIDIPFRIVDSGKTDYLPYKSINYDTTHQAYTAVLGSDFVDHERKIQDSEVYGYRNSNQKDYFNAGMYIKGFYNLYFLGKEGASGAYFSYGERGDRPDADVKESKLGWDFTVNLEDISSVSWRLQLKDQGYIDLGLTKDGHLFALNIYTQENRFKGDGVRYFCYFNGNMCTSNDDATTLYYDEGSILDGAHQNLWADNGFPYMDVQLFNLKALPTYVAPQDYLNWQKGERFENKVYLDGNLTLGNKDQVLLTESIAGMSSHKNIRLIYIAPTCEQCTDGKNIPTVPAHLEIQAQSVHDHQVGPWQKLGVSDYFTTSDDLFDGELSSIQLAGGDIQMLQNTNQSTDSVVWSIQELYQHKDAHWNANPYAWMELSQEGHLVVKGTQLDSNGKPIDIIIWDGKKDPSADKLDPVIRGTYAQNCSNIQWKFPYLSANCGGSEVKLDYYNACAELSTVSFNGSKLVCDTPARW